MLTFKGYTMKWGMTLIKAIPMAMDMICVALKRPNV